MKIVAWDERRLERDAEDLGLIMRHYLDAGNEDRIYSDQGDCSDLLNEEFDYDKASARILGRDVGKLLTDTSQRILERVLSEENSADTLATVMIRNKANYYGNYDIALTMLLQLQTGTSEN